MATPHSPTQFSRPRSALLVLLGVYPALTAILYAVRPLTDGWAIWQRTLLVTPIMAAIMVWSIIPAIQNLFRGFINPAVGTMSKTDAQLAVRCGPTAQPDLGPAHWPA